MLHPSDVDSRKGTFINSARWRPDSSATSTAALQQLDGLSDVPEGELRQIAPLCTLRVFEPGAFIVAEHARARTLLVLLHGSVTLSRADPVGNLVLLVLLGRGDVVGEGGLFGSRYRRVSDQAETRVGFLQIA